MVISELTATVSIIIQLKSGEEIGTATGFFYTNTNNIYLVTNKHVVKNPDSQIQPDTLRLILHCDPKNPRNNADYDIPLYSKTEIPLWKEHPMHVDADIVVIELDNDIKTYFVKAWSKKDFLPEKFILGIGEDVFVMGYPRAFHDSVHNLPIFRNAMIASSYGVPFNNQPYFLIDANMHKGTSGSPIITKPKNTWQTTDGNTALVSGNHYYILGINSGSFSIDDEKLGLSVIWYIHLVEEIINLF